MSIAESNTQPEASAPPVRTRAVIIGTGFAGLGMAVGTGSSAKGRAVSV